MSTGLARATTITGNSVKAIETRYAGCHFRSRLEARWAVFFDHLKIKWEYETQGWTFTHPTDGREFTYLPDFWLPELATWVEVKGGQFGEISPQDEIKCTIFAMARWVEGERFRLLWGIPRRPGENLSFPFPKELATVPCVVFSSVPPDIVNGKVNAAGPVIPGDLSGIPSWVRAGWLPATGYAAITAAFTAARSARFEHGQSGA